MRILRIRSRGLKAPRSIVTNGLALLALFVCAVVVGYLLLFNARPADTPHQFDLASTLRDVDSLSSYSVEIAVPIEVRARPVRIDDHVVDAGHPSRDIAAFPRQPADSGAPVLMQIGTVATYGTSIDMESVKVTDEVLELPTPLASLRDIARMPSRDRIIQRMPTRSDSVQPALTEEAAQQALVGARRLAERDSSALLATSARARRVLEVVARQSGRRVVFTEAK